MLFREPIGQGNVNCPILKNRTNVQSPAFIKKLSETNKSAISLYYGYRFRKNSDSLRPLLNSVAPEQCDKLVSVSSLILSLFTAFTLSILPFIIFFIFGGFGNGFMYGEVRKRLN